MSSPKASVAYVTIPATLPTLWATMDRKERREWCVLYQLKSLYQGGVLFDYAQQLPLIGETFGYSAAVLGKVIKGLIKKGHAWPGQRPGSLELLATQKLRKLIHAQLPAEWAECKRLLRIDRAHLVDLEDVLHTLCIESNLKTQTWKVRQKHYHNLLRDHLGILNPDLMTTQASRRLHKQLKRAGAVENVLTRLDTENFSVVFTAHLSFNPEVTLSRRGIAKLLGYASARSAQVLVERLVRKGYLLDVPVQLTVGGDFLGGVSYDFYQNAQQFLWHNDFHYRFTARKDGTGRGIITYRLSNQITPQLTFLF